jgi:NADH dehydrogenase (ubiquinone) 1 beta subcomplex subunit 9
VLPSNVKDPRQLAQILEQAEAKLAGWKHPDPYIRAFNPCLLKQIDIPVFAAPTAPGGTKW